ncbi:hypothetical protein M9H77_03428 [Catharanthus roseus]|uniref:Uncharacterized protein n=1 Tax=Catharanthus roseus TaxID=4058 RepID=A0ACC0CBD7_CATRO|nr:hypothetical protein M9H77_03428 [Catharanthus roseus]
MERPREKKLSRDKEISAQKNDSGKREKRCFYAKESEIIEAIEKEEMVLLLYCKGRNPEVDLGKAFRAASHTWRSLIECYKHLKHGLFWEVGDRDHVRFWIDVCLDEERLLGSCIEQGMSTFTALLPPHILEKLKLVVVSAARLDRDKPSLGGIWMVRGCSLQNQHISTHPFLRLIRLPGERFANLKGQLVFLFFSSSLGGLDSKQDYCCHPGFFPARFPTSTSASHSDQMLPAATGRRKPHNISGGKGDVPLKVENWVNCIKNCYKTMTEYPWPDMVPIFLSSHGEVDCIIFSLTCSLCRKLSVKITGHDGFEKLDIRIPVVFNVHHLQTVVGFSLHSYEVQELKLLDGTLIREPDSREVSHNSRKINETSELQEPKPHSFGREIVDKFARTQVKGKGSESDQLDCLTEQLKYRIPRQSPGSRIVDETLQMDESRKVIERSS